MKVFLLEDIKKIGKKNTVVDVNNGYALNYLFPNKLAIFFDENTKIKLLNLKNTVQKQLDKKIEQALEDKKKLSNIVVEFKKKAFPNGKIIDNISHKDIEDILKKKFNILIDRKKIINKNLITDFGIFLLKIKLFKNIIGTIKINVIKQNTD